jgi:hypothetical protein
VSILDADGNSREEWSLDDPHVMRLAFDASRDRLFALGQYNDVTLWDLAARSPRFTTIFAREETYRFDGAGRLLNERIDDASFAYLVETPEGFRTLSHAEFQIWTKNEQVAQRTAPP